MEHTPDSQKTTRPKISVSEHNLLVAHGKSKKLAAIANKSAPVPFDTVANIKNLEIKAVFKLLDINPEQLNTRSLAGLNYHGDTV